MDRMDEHLDGLAAKLKIYQRCPMGLFVELLERPFTNLDMNGLEILPVNDAGYDAFSAKLAYLLLSQYALADFKVELLFCRHTISSAI